MQLNIIGFVFTVILSFSCVDNLYGQQCKAIEFERSNLLRFRENFTHQYTFKLEKAQKIEEKYRFQSGYLYSMNISNFRGEENNIIINIYDDKGTHIASNYNPKTKRFWPLGFFCKNSVEYTIVFEFVGTDIYCGISLLGEKK